MAWRRPGDKPLSEPMIVSLPMHICITRPQWVNRLSPEQNGSYFCSLSKIWVKFIWTNNDIINWNTCVTQPQCVNSMWLSDVMWRHRTGWTPAQVMGCCLKVPSQYLNQCWYNISKVLWYSSEGIFMPQVYIISNYRYHYSAGTV